VTVVVTIGSSSDKLSRSPKDDALESIRLRRRCAV
jgi:hypothetical protein